MSDTDTIFALSTAAGKAAVSVVRISGPRAFFALETLTSLPIPAPRVAALKKLYRADGTMLDSALVLCFPAPHSFTGEDIVELHLHGSLAVTRACIGLLSGISGMRLAEPGEFTRRAFNSGKFDLLEVEALADVINAETDAQAKQAFRQFEGHIGQSYMAIRSAIVEALALLEAYIDFPEEDIPESVLGQIKVNTNSLIAKITSTLSDSGAGERIRSGFRVAIIGAPNVGKSSLLNALAKRDAAIVSEIPGTTRDIIELHMDIAGFPIILSDTAGIRETSDVVENMGISRSKNALSEADVVLVVCDASDLQKSLESVLLEVFSEVQKPTIICINKSDLCENLDDAILNCLQILSKSGQEFKNVISISTKICAGFQRLESTLAHFISELQPAEEPLITQARHRLLLESAKLHLEQSLAPLPLEIRCEELRLSAVSIGKISGAILPDELLGAIFSKFCIGK